MDHETRIIAALTKRLGGNVLLELGELAEVQGLVIQDNGRVIAS